MSTMIPDGQNITDAFARNAQMGAERKPKFDIGKFLLAWAGNMGDNLTGNPVYARSQQARMDAQAAQQQAQAQKDWWYEQQRYKSEHPDPPSVGDINNYQEAQRLGYIPQDTSYQDFLGFLHPQSPVVLPYNVKQISGNSPSPSPTSPSDNIREQAIDAIRQGADPAKVLERMNSLMGGPTPGASDNFPRY